MSSNRNTSFSFSYSYSFYFSYHCYYYYRANNIPKNENGKYIADQKLQEVLGVPVFSPTDVIIFLNSSFYSSFSNKNYYY